MTRRTEPRIAAQVRAVTAEHPVRGPVLRRRDGLRHRASLAVRSLRDDLGSGRWAERNRDLAALDAAELGLRLLVA